MTEQDFSRLAASLLSRNAEDRLPRIVDREHGIAIVARAITERARKKRRARLLVYGAAFASAAGVALVAGFLGARHATSAADATLNCSALGTCAPAAPALQVGLVDGRSFVPGQSLRARAGESTRVEFAHATEVALDPQTELEYRQGDTTRRFGLLRGAVHLRVGKLAPGQRFVVETPDTEVEVRGTEFHVALAQPGAGCVSPRTSVSVDEGVVEVRFHGETYRVTPGGHWPERCEIEAPPAAPAPPITQPSELRLEAPSAPARVPVHEKRVAAATKAASPAAVEAGSQPPESDAQSDATSALTEQNNLYAKAVAARRAGRSLEALATYEQLLERFPNGALCESARAERLRLLIRVNPAKAKVEAARYLARYPRGLASADARALLDQP
ncbi:MAG TPA: FecR family protein [Polyangiaceae bacterium]|nr:FecR family protein [Polyangiaceae bacterium]